MRGEQAMVEFDAQVSADGFAAAVIDYGDGKTYQSLDWDDAQANMFWHMYSEPGSYDVSAEITYESGFVYSTSCSFNLVERVPPPPSTIERATSQPPVARQGSPVCDPNYRGVCVPIASDVDCASGSGDGPEYVRGPVYVVGVDVYDLDRDNDGVGCENG